MVEFVVDEGDVFELIFVVIDGGLVGNHEATGQGVGRNGPIVLVGAKGDLKGPHEADVEKVLGLDLCHEVLDNSAFLVICNHQNITTLLLKIRI